MHTVVYDGSLGANIVHTQPRPAAIDIAGPPGLEILVPVYHGKLYAFGPGGDVRWGTGRGSLLRQGYVPIP